MPTTSEFVDLFDIEKRPGAGLELWTFALEMQLDRVREANFKHRLAQSFNDDERIDDPDAERRLHAEVYFLVLVIRRVLLFHDLLAKQAVDQRLPEARAKFQRAAPQAKRFRDMYEHVDAYLLDGPGKHVKFPGRASPILMSRWDCDNVTIAFGETEMDITLAAVAALELGKTSLAVWNEHMDRALATRPRQEQVPPPPPGEITHTLEVTFGLSAIVGGRDEGRQRFVGTLLDTNVRDATEEERSTYRDGQPQG
jgi:hypothetical protein